MAIRITDGYGNVMSFGTKVVNIAAQSVTGGTPVTVYTPPATKRWNVLGYQLGLSALGSVILKQAGTERCRTGQVAANTGTTSPALNVASTNAGDILQLDHSAVGAQTISGFLCLGPDLE